MAEPLLALQVKPIQTPTYGDIMQERDAYRAQQNAMAQQQLKMQQNAMLNQAYADAYDPQTGRLDTNKLNTRLARGGIGAQIPGQMEAYGKGLEAVAKGSNEQLKLKKDLLDFSHRELGNADTPEEAIAAALRTAQQFPTFAAGLLKSVEAVKGMTPEQFGAWKMDSLTKNLTEAQRLERDTQTVDTGAGGYVLDRSKYSNDPYAVVQGSQYQKTMTPQQQYEAEHPDLKPMTVEGIGLVGFDPRTNTYKTAAPAGGGGGGGGGGGIPAGRGGAVDPNAFKAAIVQKESGGDYTELSPKGALGAYQVMPATAKTLAGRLGLPWSPELMRSNTPQGRQYQDAIGNAAIQEALQAGNGDVGRAAAYYHGGSDTAKWGPKTRSYAQDIVANMGRGGAAPAAGAPAQPMGTEEVAKRKAFESILPIIGYDAKTGKNRVSDLIAASTSGGAEMLGSEVSGFFNAPTPGRKALSELNSIAASMTFEKLRGKLGAQISDSDVRLVANTMADIANGSKTAGERSAAWNNVVLPILLRGAGVESAGTGGGAAAGGGDIPTLTPEQARANPNVKRFRTTDGRVIRR